MEEINLKVTVDSSTGKKTVKEVKDEIKAAEAEAAKLGNTLGNGIGETEKKAVSLKAQLKAMILEMQGLDSSSDRFKKLSKDAGELKDRIGDINQKVTALSSDTKRLDALVGAGSAIAGGFQAASGAMALFGSNSKQVEKAIQNVIAVQGILNGVQQVGTFLTTKGIIQDYASAVSKNIQTNATYKAITAQLGLNAAMIANPIGLIVAAFIALGLAIYAVIKYYDKLIFFFKAWMGLFSEQEIAEAKAAERRTENDKLAKQHFANRKKEIEELIKAEKNAFDKRQTGFDLEIARLEAEGKSSRELKLAKIQDILDHTKAVLANNQLLIDNYVEYYKNQAMLRGQSEQEFIDSMKKQGVDLVALQTQANDALETNRQAVYQAETDLLKLKNDFRKEDAANAKEAADERARLAKEEADRLVKEAEEQRKINDFLLERTLDADKLFNERLLQEQQEQFDREFDLLEAQIDRENAAKELQAQQEKERREKQFQDTVQSAESLIKISESISTLAQGKEFKRIKAKQEAGEKLTNSEIKRLHRAEAAEKARAIAQVAIDTARGISAAVAAGAGVPYPANIPAILSGVAAVLAGVAQAKSILGDSGSSDGGGATSDITSGTDAINNTANQTPNTIQAGSTFLNQEPQKVYVVESDITKLQKSVAVNEASATWG